MTRSSACHEPEPWIAWLKKTKYSFSSSNWTITQTVLLPAERAWRKAGCHELKLLNGSSETAKGHREILECI